MKILLPNSYCFAAISLTRYIKKYNSTIEIFGTGEEKLGFASGSLLVNKYIQSPNVSGIIEYSHFLKSIMAFGILKWTR